MKGGAFGPSFLLRGEFMEKHFDDHTAEWRYKNEMIDHMRRQTELLERIVEQNAQLLYKEGPKQTDRPKRRGA